MKAHGVPWLIRHLKGEISLDDAAAGGVRDTWRYAKRQVTWFRNQMQDWPWAAPGGGAKPSKARFCGRCNLAQNSLDRAEPIIKPRNESTDRNNAAQYYYLVVTVRTPAGQP